MANQEEAVNSGYLSEALVDQEAMDLAKGEEDLAVIGVTGKKMTGMQAEVTEALDPVDEVGVEGREVQMTEAAMTRMEMHRIHFELDVAGHVGDTVVIEETRASAGRGSGPCTSSRSVNPSHMPARERSTASGTTASMHTSTSMNR